MSQNLVIPDKDNKVVFIFGGIVLADSTNITLKLGGDSFSTTGGTPKLVIIPASGNDPESLSCDLSGTAEVGKIFATVTFFDGASVNGTDITSRELGNSDQIIIAIGSQLIIEDGSIVANANSFSTDAEFKAYANIRCLSVPATEPERDALQILAMDYFFSKESRLQGSRISIDQELPYPREGVCANDFEIPSDSIPNSLKKGLMELALQAGTSDILISASITNLASFNVDGVYSESYFNGGAWETVRTDKANAYLNPLFKNGGASRLVRI